MIISLLGGNNLPKKSMFLNAKFKKWCHFSDGGPQEVFKAHLQKICSGGLEKCPKKS